MAALHVGAHDWLDQLANALANGKPVIAATLTSKTGSSPDSTGSQVIVGENFQWGRLNNPHRLNEVVGDARTLLASTDNWLERRYDLRSIVGQPNGVCHFAFQRITAQSVSSWLDEARSALAERSTVVLACQKNGDIVVVRDERDGLFRQLPSLRQFWQANQPAVQLINVPQSASQSRWLLIRLNASSWRVAVAGDGSIARAIRTQLQLLPCEIISVSSNAEAQVNNIARLPANCDLVIATGDHASDVGLCRRALAHESLRYIGCLGSTKKSALLRQTLHAQHLSTSQLARIQMPIGLPDIVSDDPAVIAISVVAQILIHPRREPTPCQP